MAHLVVPARPAGLPGVLLELRALRALLRHVERLPLLRGRLLADLAVLRMRRRTSLSLYPAINHSFFSHFGIDSKIEIRDMSSTWMLTDGPILDQV